MLELQPIEFFLRAIPEGFLFMFAIYVFSKVKINKRKYIISSIVYSISIFMIRRLPINYGVHTILAIVALLFLSIILNKIDVIKVIRSTILAFLLQFISETINLLLIQNIPNIDINKIFTDVTLKSLFGLPSLALSWVVLILIYRYYKGKGELINE